MKKNKLKLKIILTNIRRVVTSFLFINLGGLYQNIVHASNTITTEMCYAAGPSEKTEKETKFVSSLEKYQQVFIILIPVVFFIIIVLLTIKYIKDFNKKKKKDINKDDNQN